MGKRKPLREMTTEEFEAYLKKCKLTAAEVYNLAQKRRNNIRAQGWDPDKEPPVPTDATHEPSTIDIGPKTWMEVMPILEAAILNGTPEGRKMAMEQVRRMAEFSDRLAEALTLLRECRQVYHNSPLLTGVSNFNGDHTVHVNPLTEKLKNFLKQFPGA